MDDLAPADTHEGPLPQHAQQLHLQARIEPPNLVEENSAPAGPLELADVLGCRAGERSLFVSEQYALDQRRRRTVDRNERPRSSPAAVVQRAREQFPARSSFSEHEHGRVGGRHPFHQLQDLPHARIFRNRTVSVEPAADLCSQNPILIHQTPPLDQAVDEKPQFFGAAQRLAQVVGRAALDRRHPPRQPWRRT